ncbi:unnamed protein product [Angiostrongylus costaricensis]|uniref:Reverse transcriptase domain-containing protein n=1 Tax=Angiostrongylus costaricensis TaxID=334426 RepID=A0A158PM82_ANGCS|nr:unnamed protein product [Angiostrongylus costaricensis]
MDVSGRKLNKCCQEKPVLDKELIRRQLASCPFPIDKAELQYRVLFTEVMKCCKAKDMLAVSPLVSIVAIISIDRNKQRELLQRLSTLDISSGVNAHINLGFAWFELLKYCDLKYIYQTVLDLCMSSEQKAEIEKIMIELDLWKNKLELVNYRSLWHIVSDEFVLDFFSDPTFFGPPKNVPGEEGVGADAASSSDEVGPSTSGQSEDGIDGNSHYEGKEIVEIEAVLEALESQGVTTQYIKILHELQRNFETKMSPLYNDINIDVRREVRQGDTISTKLFLATIQNVTRTLEWDNTRVKIDGRQYHHLCFADVIVLITPNISQAGRMLDDFDRACRKISLRLISHAPFTLYRTNNFRMLQLCLSRSEMNMINDLAPELSKRKRAAWELSRALSM